MDELISHLDNLKLSAFSKVSVIRNEIYDVTIGPNATPAKEMRIRSFEADNKKKLSPKKAASPSITSSEILPFRQIEKEYELDRQQQVKHAVDNHVKEFEEFTNKQNETKRKQWLEQQQKFIQNLEQQDAEIIKELQKYENNKLRNNEKLVLYFKELEENRKKTAAVLEAKKHERAFLQACLSNQATFNSISQEIMLTFASITDEKLKTSIYPEWIPLKKMNETMNMLATKCKTGQITQADLKITEEIVKNVSQLKLDLFEKIQKLTHEIQQEKQKQVVPEPPQPVATIEQVQPQEKSYSLDKYISKSNMKFYTEIMAFYEDYIKSFDHLLKDERLKQFKNDCKKAVNLSVNTISAVNSQHLLDKYVKLSNLLQGKLVVIGDFQTNASYQQGGIQFCTNLLAQKFVYQGDTMVSSNPESAFSFATIITTLWNESPDLGKLILAHFYKECPFLIPFYKPRSVDQNDEEYYKSQGYKYFDGKIEKQDKYLKRMKGIMRLYFAILISTPKRGSNGNMHNLKYGWKYFVSVLKLEPRIDITATMLHTFLENIGFEMQNVYRMQFFKLLRFMVEKYLPSIKKIDNGGPVTRLECLIQEFKENGNQFKLPKGYLPKNFW